MTEPDSPCEHDNLGCGWREPHEEHTKLGDGRPCCGWPPRCDEPTHAISWHLQTVMAAIRDARSAHEWPVETDEGLDYDRCTCGWRPPLVNDALQAAVAMADHHDEALALAASSTAEHLGCAPLPRPLCSSPRAEQTQDRS